MHGNSGLRLDWSLVSEFIFKQHQSENLAVCHKINYIYKPIISFNFTGMKKTLLPILCTVCFHIQAQLREQTNLNDSLVIENIFSEEPKRFFEKEGVKMSIAPALLFTASGLTWGEKEQIREIRNR